jgi:hypothetical protein
MYLTRALTAFCRLLVNGNDEAEQTTGASAEAEEGAVEGTWCPV